MQSFGQYPEFMNKIQKHQDFCLFLEIDGRDYDKARMVSAFYMKDLNGMYQRIEMTDELLKEYGFCEENDFLLTGRRLSKIYQEKKADFIAKQEEEKKRRIEEERRQKEALKKLREAKERRDRAMEVEDARRHARIAEELRQERLRKQQEAEQRKAEEEEEEKRKQQEQEQQQKDLGELAEKVAKEIGSYIDQPYYDQSGQRWFKCETCGKVATQIEFAEYGGNHRPARGTCRDCMKKRQDGPDFNETETARNYCPRCGCELVRRTGKNGPFWGCSAYPDCTFTKKITLF